MSEFQVRIPSLNGAMDSIQTLESILQEAANGVMSVRRNLRVQIRQRERIDSRLVSSTQRLEGHRQAVGRVVSVGQQVAGLYQQTELQLLGLKNRSEAGITSESTANEQASCYPRYEGSTVSIVDALKSLGVDSSYAYREKIAEANGITNYSGTAEQNTYLLKLLKQGKLVMIGAASSVSGTVIENSAPPKTQPDSSHPGEEGTNTEQTASGNGGGVLSNLGNVPFIHQKPISCKATSVAMAINMITGGGRYNTEDMTTSKTSQICRSLDGNKYRDSDGNTYTTTYRSDSYRGSQAELKNEINRSLSDGVPIVASVHSTESRGTKHHWVVIVGKNANGDYLVVDPAQSGSGSMKDHIKTMSDLHYEFGLASSSPINYGYISFTKK